LRLSLKIEYPNQKLYFNIIIVTLFGITRLSNPWYRIPPLLVKIIQSIPFSQSKIECLYVPLLGRKNKRGGDSFVVSKSSYLCAQIGWPQIASVVASALRQTQLLHHHHLFRGPSVA
jgi:hypothetical protein